MIVDAQLQLSNAQAFTATAVTTNSYDSGAAGNDITVGKTLVVAVSVGVAADFTTGDETYQIDVIESAAAALTSPTVLASRVVTAANLTAGAMVYVPVPEGSKVLRYLGARLTLGGTTPSITATIYLLPDSSLLNLKYYRSGFTITS